MPTTQDTALVIRMRRKDKALAEERARNTGIPLATIARALLMEFARSGHLQTRALTVNGFTHAEEETMRAEVAALEKDIRTGKKRWHTSASAQSRSLKK